MPKKKWYELENRRDIFLPFTIDKVRDGVNSTLTAGGLKRKSFWSGNIKINGSLKGNFLDMSISIPSGKGDISYHVYGELVSNSKGCVIEVVIRDSNPFYTALVIAGFIAFIFFWAGTSTGIFGMFFFGLFAIAGLTIQHAMGVNAVEKAIFDSVEN